jgi:hypothetical protein
MIYIQKHLHYPNLPNGHDASCAMFGAIDSLLDFKLISVNDIQILNNNILLNNLFVGSVEFMMEIFKKLNINNYKLSENSNRVSKILTIKDAITLSKSKQIFIKPVHIKLFTGFVTKYNISILETFPDDTLVYVYDVFEHDIVSEWRLYVNKHKIYDSHNYDGDYKIIPNYDYINEVIEKNKKNNFPISYTIDVGILNNYQTVVIEYNDFWAIGNYGLYNNKYLQFLKERYFEIVRQTN